MKFALFYEIPVAAPWTPDKEHQAYKNTIEQAVLGDKMGFHAFWTVEHHFLEEYSHCSNPEVLYGAVAALTSNMRIGYGVRLLPKPYNHPIRTAESVAVLDLISDGRVDFGTGRSSTRAELEGFDVEPDETARDVARGARSHRRRVDRRRVPGRRQVLEDGREAARAARSRCSSRTRRSSARRAACPATRRWGSRASGCARSRSGSRPRCSRATSRCTARAWPSARSRRASSSTTPRRRSRWCTARPRRRKPPRSPRSRSSGTRATAAVSSRRWRSGWKSAIAPTSTPTSTPPTCWPGSVKA